MGRSIAFTLARNGAHIVLNYGTNRRDAEADRTAEEVRSAVENLGVRALVFKADTRNADEVTAMVGQAVGKLKKIDILVNNAGGAWNPKDITETSPEQFGEVIEAEINGAFNCIRECLPIMRNNRWGRIINIGAFDAGHWAAPGTAPVEYAIGKGARALLTRHLAFKERAYGITVNLVNPGPGHTAHLETIEKALSLSEHSVEWQKRVVATPQDIAEAILFLCSEQARFITGSHIGFSIE